MQSMQRWVGVVAMVVWVGCGGGSSSPDASSHTDAPGGDGPGDARAIDAMLDGGGGGNACQAITPWCADGFCLTIPAAPQVKQPPAPQPWNATATALGPNGSLFFSVTETNTIASITPSSAMGMVALPAGTQPGFKVG